MYFSITYYKEELLPPQQWNSVHFINLGTFNYQAISKLLNKAVPCSESFQEKING